MRRTIAAAAAMMLAAVSLTACAGETTQPIASVDAIPAAFMSMADSPVAWEMALDVDFDLDEVVAMGDVLDTFDGGTSAGDGSDPLSDVEEARRVVDVAKRLTLSGATDADGDSVMGFNIDGEPAVELAVGGGFAQAYMEMGTDPMAMFDADPLPMELLVRVDADRLGAFVAEMDEGTSQADVDEFLSDLRDDPAAAISGDPSASLDDLTAEMESIPAEVREQVGLPEPQALAADIEAVVDAAVNGGWFGLSGELDYAAMLESMGMTREMFEQQMEASGIDLSGAAFDPAAFQQVFADAITFRDLTPGEGGVATATMDVDTEAFALGYIDAMAAYDTMGMFDQMRRDIEAEDLPELSGVGTVTLVGDQVTELRIDLIQVGLAFAEADETVDPAEVEAVRQAVAGFETTRAAFVMRYFDHGAVDDLVDGVDAATLDASLLTSLAGMAAALDPTMMGGPTGTPALPDAGDHGTEAGGDGGVAMEQVLTEVRNAAVDVETFHAEQGKYPETLDNIRPGRSHANGVVLLLSHQDGSVCVQGVSVSTGDAAFYTTNDGQSGPGTCPVPAAGSAA